MIDAITSRAHGRADEERRRLKKLEQDLAATDPDLNLELRSGRPRGVASRAV
ncbi:DUF3040 domain-containing protein [Arthrobacter sp. SO3]|uniref:DUF3040 domain-containing protein n=1 Tax=Arthrobacter sp. SO3 TaxID=1897057 RepID=UPI001CFFDD58|nr:DUF3040 domain-containing protein [Arthrobacter sp. SO3]MCB5293930.1 hypothetical protein [Arthrobacter sp. SO3]